MGAGDVSSLSLTHRQVALGFISLEMFPALEGEPSAYISSSLECRSPLLITQLGASFVMLWVVLSNSQNGHCKVKLMQRMGMTVVVCSVRLKELG